MEFTNKVVIVTGSSAGIGAATAILYSKYSAKVVLVGRNETNLKKVAEKCEAAKGNKPLSIVADVSVVDDLKRIVDETLKHFGRIDILVNNAAAVKMDYIRSIDLENIFTPLFNTNLRSIYVLTNLVLPHLIKTKGNVVNVSSIASNVAVPKFLTYSMTKAALDQFTRIVAYDVAADGVRVNNVSPGLTISDVYKQLGIPEESKDMLMEEAIKENPLQRAAECEEIAQTIAFLSSDLAKNITGTILVSDSGRSLGLALPSDTQPSKV